MKKSICLCLLIALVLIGTGCNIQTDFSKPQIETEVTDAGITVYSSDTALGALEYTIAVNKEIGIAMNLLEGHMATGKMVADGNYPVSDELLNLSASLDVLQETIDSVDSLNPPQDYGDERITVVQKLTNAQKTMVAYQKYLSLNDIASMYDAIELMEGDFTSLKMSFNNIGE